jgi:hypothetical protein
MSTKREIEIGSNLGCLLMLLVIVGGPTIVLVCLFGGCH